MSDVQFHRVTARRLVRAVGGVEEAAAICGLSCPSQPSRWQTGAQLMNAMQIELLERVAGEPIYSRALSRLASDETRASDTPLAHAAHAAREAASLPALIIEALADGRIDERERRALLDTIQAAEEQLRKARQALACGADRRAAE